VAPHSERGAHLSSLLRASRHAACSESYRFLSVSWPDRDSQQSGAGARSARRSQQANRPDQTMHQSAYRLSPDDYLSDSAPSSVWKVSNYQHRDHHWLNFWQCASWKIENITLTNRTEQMDSNSH